MGYTLPALKHKGTHTETESDTRETGGGIVRDIAFYEVNMLPCSAH
jgi:hypothetical protein